MTFIDKEPENGGIKGNEPINNLIDKYSFPQILDHISKWYAKNGEMPASNEVEKLAKEFRLKHLYSKHEV